GHDQGDLAEAFAPSGYGDVGAPAVDGQDLAPDLGGGGEPVGDHLAGGGPGQAEGAGIVGAEDGRAAGRKPADEGPEGGRDRGQVAPVVEVVGLDVGDHGHLGGQLQERPVGLVGLGHEGGTPPGGGVDAAGLEVATDRERRVEPGRLQDGNDHAGGGGLAVGARDRDAVLARHEESQQLSPAQHGDVEDPGRDQLGVGGPDGGRGDHQVGPSQPSAVVAGPGGGGNGGPRRA